MPPFVTENLRNIVLLSHSGAGKTILAESMLHSAGVTTRMGTIEDGTTASDYEPEESRRQTSVQTSILPCPWRGNKINIIDTPGYADFRGEVISGARVADGAIIVVSAPAGIEVGTRQMWRMCDELNLPRMVFISKMDRENADFQRVMDAVTEVLGRHCVPVNIPIGSEASFTGIVNLLDPDSQASDGLEDTVEAARERLIEAVAEADDDLATKYLEGESLTREELTAGLRGGIASGGIVPILVGAAESGIGEKELMDAILDFIPSPAQAANGTATESGDLGLTCDSSGPLAALVFKTAADPFVGKLSYIRVYNGTLKSDSQVWNAGAGEAERVGQAYVVTGKSQESVDGLASGDIGAIPKLSSALTGHTLCTREKPVTLPGIGFPRPVYQMAAFPKSKADVDKMTSSLARIAEEDPSLVVSREPNTLEVLLGGMGDMHVEVAVEKMKRKFGAEILLEVPKVPYKETISTTIRSEYKHKKQSGGHGQYGHVYLDLEPLGRGAGFEFADKVVGGSVPREYIGSVEKGILRTLGGGAIAGFPIVDLKATLVDGSYHSVDSSGNSFEIAGSHALSQGILQAGPVLLEPVMQAKITVPDEFTGDVIGELNSKRGRIQGMVPQGDGTTEIEVEVPQAEMLRYSTELRSQTQGQGVFTMEFDHYEEVPQHLMAQVVEETKQKEEAKA